MSNQTSIPHSSLFSIREVLIDEYYMSFITSPPELSSCAQENIWPERMQIAWVLDFLREVRYLWPQAMCGGSTWSLLFLSALLAFLGGFISGGALVILWVSPSCRRGIQLLITAGLSRRTTNLSCALGRGSDSIGRTVHELGVQPGRGHLGPRWTDHHCFSHWDSDR